jgi:hypothetical protein
MTGCLPAVGARSAGVALWALLVCAGAVFAQEPPGLARDCLIANMRWQQRTCAVADLDADQRADYAFATVGRTLTLSLWLSGRATAVELVTPPGREAFSYAFRDVDGDGDLDIALLGAGEQTVGVFLNDGQGGFAFDDQDRFVTAPYSDPVRIGVSTTRVAWPCASWNTGTDSTALESVSAIHAPRAPKPLVERSLLAAAQQPCGSPRSRAP